MIARVSSAVLFLVLLSAVPSFPAEVSPSAAGDNVTLPAEKGARAEQGGGTVDNATPAVDNVSAAGDNTSLAAEEEAPGEPEGAVADPLEPVNRAIFVFNDKAYFWVVKPVAKGYSAVVPEPVRVSVGNVFSNLATPIRFVGNLRGGEAKGAGVEVLRLLINTTFGIGGLFDAAQYAFHIEKRNSDLGLALGKYGLGHGIYLVLPILGPSSLRDFVGYAGDTFLDPVNYVGTLPVTVGIQAYRYENDASLHIGEYEDLKAAALDPYVSVKDAYIQYRNKRARGPGPSPHPSP